MAMYFKYVLVAWLVVSASNALNWTHIWHFPGWRFQCPTPTTRYGVGFMDCVYVCAQRDTCQVVSYNTESQKCDECDKWRLRADEESYSTIAIVRIIGMLTLKKTSGSYSYSEAQERCGRFLGARLLTLTEIEDLYTAGYERCKCTWLLGGAMYSVGQKGSGCKGVLKCNDNKAEAWCTENPFIIP